MISSTAVAILLVGAVCCAPPIEPELDPTEASTSVNVTTITPAVTEAIGEISDSVENDKNKDVAVAPTIEAITIEAITVGYPTSPQPPPTTPAMSGPERRALISHLSEYDLRTVDPLVLTPRQQAAILQELEHQELGLPPFTDPTPWQRLTREQQMEFNRKYLALRGDLQEYSRNQFLSLSEDRQTHAYQAFLSVDLQTLSKAIQIELSRERQVLNQQNKNQQLNIIIEQQALDEQQNIAEIQRVSEKQRVAEQQGIAEQQRFAEQQRVVEQQAKLAEQKILVEQQSLQAKNAKGLVEEHILAEQVRLYEQQKLAFEQSFSEKQKHIEKQKALEKQRQQGINKLFEVALSQQDDRVTTAEEPRSQSRNTIQSLEELNEISNAMFEHSQPAHVSPQLIKAKSPSKQRNRQIKQKFLNLLRKQSEDSIPPSLRELQRQQRRLNIRRLMFDPRRSQ